MSGSVWHADYRFFSDSTCVQPTLTGSATGHFVPSPTATPAKLQGATHFDFLVEQAFLTLIDQALVTSLQHDKRCGPDGLWEVSLLDLACFHLHSTELVDLTIHFKS